MILFDPGEVGLVRNACCSFSANQHAPPTRYFKSCGLLISHSLKRGSYIQTKQQVASACGCYGIHVSCDLSQEGGGAGDREGAKIGKPTPHPY